MLEILNDGLGYVIRGIVWVRGILNNVAGWLPFDEQLGLMIILLVASLLAGHFITKRFVMKPFQLSYLPWLLLISISIYLNLMYL